MVERSSSPGTADVDTNVDGNAARTPIGGCSRAFFGVISAFAQAGGKRASVCRCSSTLVSTWNRVVGWFVA
jgi:hypothetical protein